LQTHPGLLVQTAFLWQFLVSGQLFEHSIFAFLAFFLPLSAAKETPDISEIANAANITFFILTIIN
jgi:hypothetical protein